MAILPDWLLLKKEQKLVMKDTARAQSSLGGVQVRLFIEQHEKCIRSLGDQLNQMYTRLSDGIKASNLDPNLKKKVLAFRNEQEM